MQHLTSSAEKECGIALYFEFSFGTLLSTATIFKTENILIEELFEAGNNREMHEVDIEGEYLDYLDTFYEAALLDEV